MKTKILTLTLSLVGIMMFGQRREIRNAQHAVEDNNFDKAKTLLNSVESQISEEKDRVQSDFYLAKGMAYLGDGENKSEQDLITAADAFQAAIKHGEEEQGQNGVASVRQALLNQAVSDQNAEKYESAAGKLLKSFELNPTDTLHLYYAAADYGAAKKIDLSLKYFEQLLDMGYTGTSMIYTAVNKETGEEEQFSTASQRDIYIKSGKYIKPGERRNDSKVGDITKNIAIIYLQKGDTDKAMKALQEAKKNNPEDSSLILAEANIYYQMGEIDKYNEAIKKVLKKDPENGNLYYNLGVTASQAGNGEDAMKYYKNAIKYEPKMTKAYSNMAQQVLVQEDTLITQMNNLGMSKADNKKYKQLAKDRKDLYRDALPYLEKVRELKPDDAENNRTLLSIYQQVGEDAKAKALKEEM